MTEEPSPRLLWTVAELCQATGLGRTTLYGQIKQGRLRAHKCGRRTLFCAADVEAWLSTLPELSPRAAADKSSSRATTNLTNAAKKRTAPTRGPPP
jgi:excisionase family DNA binding protein